MSDQKTIVGGKDDEEEETFNITMEDITGRNKR